MDHIWLVTELDQSLPTRQTAWTDEADARQEFIRRAAELFDSFDRAIDELGEQPDPTSARTIIDYASGITLRIVTVRLNPSSP